MITRRRAIRIIIEFVLFDLVTSALVSLVVAYPMMLALGGMHRQWPDIPALGWWTTYIIFVTWLMFISTTRTIAEPPKEKTSVRREVQ